MDKQTDAPADRIADVQAKLNQITAAQVEIYNELLSPAEDAGVLAIFANYLKQKT